MSNQLTVEQLQTAMPTQIKAKITQTLVDKVNNLGLDPEFAEHYRDNLVSYASVMQEGRFTGEQYLNAVRYVSFKIIGDTNIKAYMRTFPTKYADFKAKGVRDKDIASYVTAFNKSKLVTLIWEQSLIPIHISNSHVLQEAINTQARIMVDPNASFKVQSDAANSLMTHLKAPETKKLEIEVHHKESSIIDDLRLATAEHAKALKANIEAGALTVKDAAHGDLVIEAEFEEVDR